MTVPSTDVDTAALRSRLEVELGIEVTEIEFLSDTLNLMLTISTPDTCPAFVFRRPNELRQTGLFIDLKTEHDLLHRLESTAIPAPAPVVFWEDESVVSGPFIVVTYLEGETIPLGGSLPSAWQHRTARRQVAYRLIDTLADIHSVAIEPFEDGLELMSPTDQVDRATERLDDARQVLGREYSVLRSVGDWLSVHAPPPRSPTLIHGDYRPSNVVFDSGREPAVAGVIDWETAMFGDPFTELGYLLLRWRDPGDPTPDIGAIDADAAAIQRLAAINQAGLSPFTARPGSPTRQALIRRYEAHTGRSLDDGRYYLAQAAYLLAAVWADLDRLERESTGEPERGPMIEYLSLLADSFVTGSFQM